MALVDDSGAGATADDPEALLNEWLGELTVLTAGLNSSSDVSSALRPLEIVAPRIDSYRFSMANLEETQDADLDAILGELCALDSEYDEELSRVSSGIHLTAKGRSEGPSEGCSQRQDKDCSDGASSIARTDSPDNDSAFSDTVSMLSSESSASSSASSKCKALKLNIHQNQKDSSFQQKADKIKLALERMREANVKKLFIKAFSMDGSSKSLLVDEKMTCGYVTRLLADKNHVTMEPKWAIVEHLPDLHMERVYEDHEMLVDNLMLWTRESKNRILFADRYDKISLFQTPEKFLLSEDDRGWSSEHDEHSRHVIIEDFFGQSTGVSSATPSVSGHPVPHMEGPLYLKNDTKKGWKKIHCVLRPSGLYYSPKDKVKTLKELVCLATFDTNEVYIGLNWKKKYKSPTDYCFAIKHPRLQQPKSVKFIKFLCADDQCTLDRWVTAMRIAKHGRQLLENYRSLVEELTQEDLDHLAHARSCSITSIPTKTNGNLGAGISSPAQSSVSSNTSVANSDTSSGRHSRASSRSSSSSGCLSDGGTASESAFDCEFPMGTIKRKPSMKPNIPLTWMTRQLKEMVEKGDECGVEDDGSGDTGTLTRRPRTNRSEDSTLKRYHTLVKVNRTRPPIFLDRDSRCWVWRACTYLDLLEYGVPGQVCRLIEFYMGEKVREFAKTKPTKYYYLQFRTSLNKRFPLNMAAALIIATKLYHNTRTIDPVIALDCLRVHGFNNYTPEQIKETVCELINIHDVRFPIWSTVQTAELIAAYADIPVCAFNFMQVVANVAEFMRYRVDVDLRQSLTENIFGTDRVSALNLAAASAYTAAKHFGYDTPETLPLLAYLTSTSNIYLLSLSNLLLYYTESEEFP